MKILKKHLGIFKNIKNRYLPDTEIPERGNWKHHNNNTLWLRLVGQVIVVGNSGPGDEFGKNSRLRELISYKSLLSTRKDKNIKKIIHNVLRSIGARYSSKSISKCRKTSSLLYNFQYLKNYKGGPKGFIKDIAHISKDNKKIDKIKNNIKFVKNKGARDYLMELGIIRNSIALDIRIQTVFKKVGIRVPGGLENMSILYSQIENMVLKKICKPLKMTGVQFDRMIYQNYDEILGYLRK